MAFWTSSSGNQGSGRPYFSRRRLKTLPLNNSAGLGVLVSFLVLAFDVCDWLE
jgi:hypothetical protein